MGIAGLHGLLKSIQKPCNLRKFKGQTIGVDAYGWLHRGTVACAIDLALDKHNTKYVDFAMNRVRMLLYFGVTPYLVFDGDNLPSKAGTEASRAQRREDSKKLGLELYRAGRISEAHQELQKAVDVTPYMARLMIEELKKLKIQYVVAPYEADAQLVYLEKQGIINGIISEDSDLLVFGAKRLLSKLDKHGDCIEINRTDFTACRDISLIGWSDADFRQMCILSGCDYLPNIPKMGLKTAYRSIRKYKTVEKVLKMIQFEGNNRVPPDYLENFKKAELTFLHQWVFCPKARKLVTLSPLTGDTTLDNLPFIGADLDPDVAVGIACGDLDPMTKDFINLQPSYPERSRLTISRRQTLASTDLKPSKPISSFFTPKRVPLGELDPNSLTPSPSQQRLLELNARRTWVTNSAPSRGTVRRISSSNDTFGQSASPLNSERESFLARASTPSKFQPIKRQRLCSDADEDAAIVLPATEKRSRFFTPADKPDPAKPDKSRMKKAKRANFGVFSDDVVEDIMSQLPDDPTAITTTNQEADTTAVHDSCIDKDGISGAEPSDTQNTQPSIAGGGQSFAVEKTATSGLSQAMLGMSARIGSDQEHHGESLEYTESKPSSKLDRFAYTTSASPKEPDNGRGEKRAQQSRTTALERLRRSALTRSKSLESLRTKPFCGSPVAEPEAVADPVPPRTHSPDRSASALSHRGSEDMIVPDSEDDGEDLLAEPGQKGAVDLKKFLFTPGE
ncbi:Rad2 nuclease [Onygenales sp. PD_40]|nr:Rad2 nuclease [Onygenales sp. PD_40]